MKRIILDTNFLISICNFKVDINGIENIIDEPFELETLNLVVNELKRIAGSNGKDSKASKLALKLLEQKNVKILKSDETDTDKTIVDFSGENTIVATNDKELRKKLKNKGIKTIYLRSKKHLAIG